MRGFESIKKYPVVLAFAGAGEGCQQGFENRCPATTGLQRGLEKRKFLRRRLRGFSSNMKSIQDSAAALYRPYFRARRFRWRDPPHSLRRQFRGRLLRVFGEIATYRTYLDNEPMRIVMRPERRRWHPEAQASDHQRYSHFRSTIQATTLIPYRGKSPMFRYISATDVLRELTPGRTDGQDRHRRHFG